MGEQKRHPTTVYLHPKIARAVKVKAALTDKSVSDLVNDALSQRLRQDEEDLGLIRERKRERGRDFEDILADLKKDGLL